MPGASIKDLVTPKLLRGQIPTPLLTKQLRRKNPDQLALGEIMAPAVSGTDLAIPVRISANSRAGNTAQCFLVVTPLDEDPIYYQLRSSEDTGQYQLYISLAQEGHYQLKVVAYLCAFTELLARWQQLSHSFQLSPTLWREQMQSLLAQSASVLNEAGSQKSRPQAIRKRIQKLALRISEIRLTANDFALRAPSARHTQQALAEVSTELFGDALSAEFKIRPIVTSLNLSKTKDLKVNERHSTFANWLEYSLRSAGAQTQSERSVRTGSFRSASAELEHIAQLGTTVLAVSGLHAHGITHRLGADGVSWGGADAAGAEDSIGRGSFGFTDISPSLGDEDEFLAYVAAARARGIRLCVELSFCSSPGHPWLNSHPNWYRSNANGEPEIRYADTGIRPDQFPIYVSTDPDAAVQEYLAIIKCWVERGVKIFRVTAAEHVPLTFFEKLAAAIDRNELSAKLVLQSQILHTGDKALSEIFWLHDAGFATKNTKAELEHYLISTLGAYQHPQQQQQAQARTAILDTVSSANYLSEFIQFGSLAAFKIRTTLAATLTPAYQISNGLVQGETITFPNTQVPNPNETFSVVARNAVQNGRDNERSDYLSKLNQIRNRFRTLIESGQLALHSCDDASILVYSLHNQLLPPGTRSLIVVINLDPHAVRESTVRLRLPLLAMRQDETVGVEDLITGAHWDWQDTNYVRLDSFHEPAHLLRIKDDR